MSQQSLWPGLMHHSELIVTLLTTECGERIHCNKHDYCVNFRASLKHAHAIYTAIFKFVKKMKLFSRTILVFFLILAQNINCGYTLEPPRRGGSDEYPHSMSWSKNKKKWYTSAAPVFLYKSGVQWGILFMDMFSCR